MQKIQRIDFFFNFSICLFCLIYQKTNKQSIPKMHCCCSKMTEECRTSFLRTLEFMTQFLKFFKFSNFFYIFHSFFVVVVKSVSRERSLRLIEKVLFLSRLLAAMPASVSAAPQESHFDTIIVYIHTSRVP